MFSDPAFQPKAFTKKEVMAAFAALAARRPFFNIKEAGWLVPIIQDCDARNLPFDQMVRIARDTDPAAIDRLLNRDPIEEGPVIDIADQLATFATRTGLIDMAKAGYMVPILNDGLAKNEYREALASQIKTAPPLLDVAAKRAAGINTRLKIGAPFADSLTEAGRENPVGAAAALADHFLTLLAPELDDGPATEQLLGAIIDAPFKERDWQRQLRNAVEAGNPVRFSAVMDLRTCDAAKAIHGAFFEIGDHPVLPLPACDQLACRCTWMNVPRGSAERRFGYVASPAVSSMSPIVTAEVSRSQSSAPDEFARAGDGLALFTAFMARKQNCALGEIRVIEGDPMQAVELLWFWMEPMQAVRRDPAVAELLDRTGYDPSGEADVDAMLERVAAGAGNNFSNETNAGVTVWTERVMQAIMTMMVKAQQGMSTVLPPPDMEKQDRQIAIGLLWLYKMDLPFPPGKSGFKLPATSHAGSIESDSPTSVMGILGIILAGLVFVAILLLAANR